MDPLIGASLVNLGGGFLNALLQPSLSKQLRLQRESDQKQADWSAGRVTAALKPQTPYYQSGNLPQLGTASMQAVMGNLAQRLGPEVLAKWGINPAVPAPAPAQPPAAPPQAPRFAGEDRLRKRYGV